MRPREPGAGEANLAPPSWCDRSDVRAWLRRRLDAEPIAIFAQGLTVASPVIGAPRLWINGRPPMTEQQRRARYPVHDAAALALKIEAWLRESYPDQPAGEIRDLAIEVAARRKGVAEQTIINHLRRSKRDRHRISP